MKPDYEKALNKLVAAHEEAEELEQALTHMKKLVEINPAKYAFRARDLEQK